MTGRPNYVWRVHATRFSQAGRSGHVQLCLFGLHAACVPKGKQGRHTQLLEAVWRRDVLLLWTDVPLCAEQRLVIQYMPAAQAAAH